MRFLTVSLLFVFLSFIQLTVCGQSKQASFFPGFSLGSITNNQELVCFNITKMSNFKNWENTFYYSSYSELASSALATENSSIETGAIIGGMLGFIAGGMVGGLANAETNMAGSALSLFLWNDEEREIIEEQVPYIVIGTLAGVGIGALIGKSRDRVTIRNREYFIDFQTEWASAPTSTNEMAFLLNISICY